MTNALGSQCQFTLKLKDGAIQYAGIATSKTKSKLAILGGTGAYSKARGFVAGTQTSTNNHDLVFHIQQ